MEKLESTAIAATKEVSDLLLPHFGKIDVVKSKSSFAHDIVTELDLEAEKLIAQRFASRFPEIGFVGEEGENKNDKERFWLVDPIDGTAHYVRGLPFCTTMICLVDKGEVILSVINNFVTGELFSASKNRGAKLNGKAINVSGRSLAESYISVESKLDNEETLKKYLALKRRTTIFHTISCGYEYGLIASGKLEGRICIDPYGEDYDYAQGALLVSEAGGIVRNIGSRTYDYKNHNFIAANPAVYKELTEGDDAIFPLK